MFLIFHIKGKIKECNVSDDGVKLIDRKHPDIKRPKRRRIDSTINNSKITMYFNSDLSNIKDKFVELNSKDTLDIEVIREVNTDNSLGATMHDTEETNLSHEINNADIDYRKGTSQE